MKYRVIYYIQYEFVNVITHPYPDHNFCFVNAARGRMGHAMDG